MRNQFIDSILPDGQLAWDWHDNWMLNTCNYSHEVNTM